MMEWRVKYEAEKAPEAWCVYVRPDGGSEVCKAGFDSREKADRWILDEQKRLEHPPVKDKEDPVEEASIESFPASDPPSWTSVTAT